MTATTTKNFEILGETFQATGETTNQAETLPEKRTVLSQPAAGLPPSLDAERTRSSKMRRTWTVDFKREKLFITIVFESSERTIKITTGGNTKMRSLGEQVSKLLAGKSVAAVVSFLNGFRAVDEYRAFFHGRTVGSPQQAIAECLRIFAKQIGEGGIGSAP